MTTIQEIKNYVLLDWDESFDSQVTSWIAQITKYIETYTERKFGVTSDAQETRLYDGNGKEKLLIDDLIELDGVEVEGTELVCLSYPANTTPKIYLFCEKGFPRGNQNIEVTGLWGYSEDVPEDIKFATTVLVSGIILNQVKTDQTITRERIGNYEVAYRTEKERSDLAEAMDVLNRYRRISI